MCVVDSVVSRLIRVRFDFSLLTAFASPCHPSPLVFPAPYKHPSSSLEIEKNKKWEELLTIDLLLGGHDPHIWLDLFLFGLALVLCVQLCMRLLSRPWPPHPPTTLLSISLNHFKNDGTVPTTTASEPRSSRVSRGDHRQSEPQSLPSRSCSAQLRTTASTTQPSSFVLFN